MNRRGWIGWIERNPVTAAVFSFLLGLSLAATGFLAAEVGVGPSSPTIDNGGVAAPGFGDTGGTSDGTSDGTTGGFDGTDAYPTDGTDASGVGDTGTTGGSSTSGGTSGSTGGTTGGSTGGSSGGSTGGSTGGSSGGSTGGSSGGTSGGSTVGSAGGSGGTTTGTTGGAACTPDPNYTATGITKDEVVIGIITSEVSVLPQQFAPVREGLEAVVKRINAEGGICGRKIRIEKRNDNANPSSTQSQYQQLVSQVFTFVGITSLQDGQIYQGSKPFNPIEKDGDEYVPDIGGFALTYTRSQSPWFAGPLGAVSPTLVGGVSFKGYQEELRAQGRECTKGGVVYLTEPTGASEDQARLGQVSIAEDWGMGLGPDSSIGYQQQLAASTAQYRLTVQQMLNDGVDCVFTYADLQSNVNLVQAAAQEGAWPTAKCTTPTRCFDLIYQPFAGYEPSFIDQLGENALGVHTFVPHLPFEDKGNPTLDRYLADLQAADSDFAPSTFSVVGYSSGEMFATLLRQCGARPTRECMHQGMFRLENWTPAGLVGPITPFRTSRATWNSPFGTYDFKWVFNCVNRLQVQKVGNALAWRRTGPQNAYECGGIHVARTL